MPLLAVIAGSLVGAGLRLGVDALIPHADTQLPWSTLIINVAGAFALAVLVARVWPVAPEWLRAALGPGLLGTFTTFSALAVSLVSLADAGEWGVAVLYLAVTMVAGLLAAWAGLSLGHRRTVPVLEPDE